MANPSLIESRVVLIADLNSLNTNKSISAAILYYKELYGEPRRVWVNPKDYKEDMEEIDGYKIEKRGGCCRGKVMVM